MILTRPAIADDHDFIVSGWSASLRASRDIPLVPMAIYAETFRPIIERHLEAARVVVAHGETGLLFGFIVFDPAIYVATLGRRRVTLAGYVLYVYVASPFRLRGIARRLFDAAGINPTQRFGYACRTRSSWELRSKTPLAEHEPFRARFQETKHGRDEHDPQAAAAAGGAQGEPGRIPISWICFRENEDLPGGNALVQLLDCTPQKSPGRQFFVAHFVPAHQVIELEFWKNEKSDPIRRRVPIGSTRWFGDLR